MCVVPPPCQKTVQVKLHILVMHEYCLFFNATTWTNRNTESLHNREGNHDNGVTLQVTQVAILKMSVRRLRSPNSRSPPALQNINKIDQATMRYLSKSSPESADLEATLALRGYL